MPEEKNEELERLTADLRDKAIKSEKEVFETSSFEREDGGPKFVSHKGFEKPSDLENYIRELEQEIEELILKHRGTESKQGLCERLDELEKLVDEEEEKAIKWPHLKEECDKRSDKYVEEFCEVYDELEREIGILETKRNKVTELKNALERWETKIRTRLKPAVKEIMKIKEQISNAQKELKEREQRVYLGTATRLDTDRIEILKDVIAELEAKRREFMIGRGIKPEAYTPTKDTVTVQFKSIGIGDDELALTDWKTIEVPKGSTIEDPGIPELKPRFTFKQWTKDGEPFDFSQPIETDTVLEAGVQPKHKIEFSLNEGATVIPLYIDDGQLISQDVQDQLKKIANKKEYCPKTKEFKTWIDESNKPFDFSEPITEDKLVTAKYGFPWKKAAHFAVGAMIGLVGPAVDAYTHSPGTVAGIEGGVLTALGGWAAFKLKNIKEPIPKEEIQSLKGIKKASAKVKNFFRDPKVLKAIRNTSLTAGITSLLGSAVNLGIHHHLNSTTPPTPTPTPTPTTPPIAEAASPIENVRIEELNELASGANFPVHDTAVDAMKGLNSETPIKEVWNQGVQLKDVFTSTGQRIPVKGNETLGEICKNTGLKIEDLLNGSAFNFADGKGPVGWVDPKEVIPTVIETVGRGR